MTSNPDVPPFIGYVETTVNALRLIHAARQGVIPRITRRLNDSERRTMIKSGAVFVFAVQESQIKRWTDGLLWSPSRIVGNFLVYREINERSSSRGHKKPYPHDDSPTRSLTGKSSPDQASLGFRANGGSDQGTFKTGGLIKKTITVIVQESSNPEPTHLHLISYYTSDDIRSGKLKRPSTRPDIMNLYMPPHIFRLTTFRVPPKVEIGPDGKPRLVEAEDLEPVDCKVEDSGYSIPASPTWSSQGSPTSPVDNPFHGSSLYPLNSGHASASSGVYHASRGAPNEKWPGQNDSMLSPLQRQEMSWSPPGGTVLSSGHTMSRRRDSVMQSEAWPSMHSQSGRWQGQSHESSPSSSSSSGLYPERPRIRANQLYDDSQVVQRRDHEGMAPNFPLRYPPHSAGTREGALQRLHWHSRDTPDSVRDPRRCNTQSAQNSFSTSPTMPFSQGYHSTQPTYSSSWTSTDSNLMTTPTLHSIAQSPLSYDGSYSSNSASIPSPDEFTNVDGYRDS